MQWHETPEVQALRREWYAKLKEEGFKDIEQVVDDRGTVGALLLGVSQGDLRRRLYKPETEQYYTLARQHLHTIERRPAKSRMRCAQAIWALHSEGYGERRGCAVLAAKGKTVTPGHYKKVVADERARMMRRAMKEADENAKAAIAAWAEEDE